MLIRILPKVKIPNNVAIAFSGGIDSLAITSFLLKGNKEVTLLHFNHGCEYSDKIEEGCREIASQLECNIVVQKNPIPICPKGRSLEDHWRRMRYRFLREYDGKVITAHHIDDAMETWIWSSCHGKGKLIPYESGNIIRPFLTTNKQSFVEYCNKNNLVPVDDPYNRELHLTRNNIRANIMPLIKQINPGLEKVIRKKYLLEEK